MAEKSLRSTLLAIVVAAFVAVALSPFANHVTSFAHFAVPDVSTRAFAVSDWSGQVNGKVLDGAIIKMRPHDYFNTANIHYDGRARGDVIYLYNLGTTSKWHLTRVKDTDYYYIGAYKDFTNRREPNSDLFDVDAQSKKSGAIVHSWPGYSNDYSRHWKFERQSNGTYLIINRNSGLYLSLEGDAEDTQGKKFCQSSTPMYWDVEIVGVGTMKSSTHNDYGVINQYSSYPGANWMSRLYDWTNLTELSIPGTHDTGTCYTWGDISPDMSFTACQQYFIREQLAAGARFFDIRMGIDGFSDLDPYINHGGTVCRTEQEKDMQLSMVMDYFKDFLEQNPSEFIILLASHSGGDVKNQANSLNKYIQESPELFYLQQNNKVPTVGDLRGKIYLAHRLDLSGTNYSEWDLGLNLSQWASDFTTSDHGPLLINTSTLFVYAQDKYNTNADDKISYVHKTFSAAADDAEWDWNKLFINYTSCTKSNPFSAAVAMNNHLNKDAYFNGTGNRLGIVVMDFMDAKMAYEVYKQNPGVYESLYAFRNAPLTCVCNHEGTWIQDGQWWYAHHDGSYTKNGWERIGDKWYAFDQDGWMKTGWMSDKGKWYYLKPGAGAMATGWQSVKGTWYYFDPASGAMASGWKKVDGTWYYFSSKHDGTYGAMQSGWLLDKGTWYYLNPNHDGTFGAMQTGWVLDHGTWYYLRDNGAMTTQWFKADGTWYYANASSGALKTGWLLDGDTWYYLNPRHDGTFGAMVTGWVRDRGTWYYLDTDGKMATGWRLVNDTWYYLDKDGAMAADTWVDGYYVDASGAWIPGVEKADEGEGAEENNKPEISEDDTEDTITEEGNEKDSAEEGEQPDEGESVEKGGEDAKDGEADIVNANDKEVQGKEVKLVAEVTEDVEDETL